MPKVQETAKPKELRAVSFHVNEQEYAVDIAQVVEIIYSKPVTPIPQAPSFIEGVIDLRGAVIPILDLKKRLELGSDQPAARPAAPARSAPARPAGGGGGQADPAEGHGPVGSGYILIVKIQDRYLGIVVDRVREVLDIEIDKIQLPDKMVRGKHSEFLAGVCKVADRLVLLLNVETLLSMDETDRLAEI